MNDVLMWSNAGSPHRVLPLDKSTRLQRVTVLGEEPLAAAA